MRRGVESLEPRMIPDMRKMVRKTKGMEGRRCAWLMEWRVRRPRWRTGSVTELLVSLPKP